MQQYGVSSDLTVQLAGPFGSVGSTGKLTQVILRAGSWKNAQSPYFQDVVIDGISAGSMVNIQATREQLAQLGENGTAIHIDNDGGSATAWAMGTKPAEDLALQVSLLEVVSV